MSRGNRQHAGLRERPVPDRRSAPASASARRGHLLDEAAVWLALVLVVAQPVWAEDAATGPAWRMDAAQSRIGFELAALGIVPLRGRFEHFHGDIEVDRDGGHRINLVIDAESLAMDRPRYANWARSSEFFHVQRHPEVRFVSEPLTAVPVGVGELVGELTLRGITRTIAFQISPIDCPADADTCAVHVEGNVDRRQFGMRSRRMTLSSMVHLDMVIVVVRDTR